MGIIHSKDDIMPKKDAYTQALEEALLGGSLPADKQAELDELKIDDPDAYIAELPKAQAAARAERELFLKSLQAEAEKQEGIRAVRDLSESGVKITDAFVQNQVPAAWTRQLQQGALSPKEYAEKIQTLVENGVVEKGGFEYNAPNLGDVGGKDTQPKTKPDEYDEYSSGDMTF